MPLLPDVTERELPSCQPAKNDPIAPFAGLLKIFFIGAGAILSFLEGSLSPEAQLAVAAYRGVHGSIESLMKQCGSGKELLDRGFLEDVDLATAFDVSDCVPILTDGAYIARRRPVRTSDKETSESS